MEQIIKFVMSCFYEDIDVTNNLPNSSLNEENVDQFCNDSSLKKENDYPMVKLGDVSSSNTNSKPIKELVKLSLKERRGVVSPVLDLELDDLSYITKRFNSLNEGDGSPTFSDSPTSSSSSSSSTYSTSPTIKEGDITPKGDTTPKGTHQLGK